MHVLDLTLPSPAENLAVDEALLDAAEAGLAGPTLRFWTPADCFVVVGYANRVATEVNVAACAAEAVPIYRRCSGGGTVVQGPGCLNYALILRAEPGTPLASITGANQLIMERQRAAVAGLVGDAVAVQGHTDLTFAGRKFSGNSQRRRRAFLLFHGSFLLGFDLARIQRWLERPSWEPAYRAGRSHRDFVTNLPVAPESLKAALATAWGANSPPATALHLPPALVEKYQSQAWNFRL